jgi:hypothetical protein
VPGWRSSTAATCSVSDTFDRARRTVPLSPAVVAMLRKYKAAQAAEKLRASNQWRGSGLVFTNELLAAIGKPYLESRHDA